MLNSLSRHHIDDIKLIVGRKKFDPENSENVLHLLNIFLKEF